MKTSFALVAIAATTIVGGSAFARSASAQTVPEGQSCGGLLCDMGVFGHKTAPAPPPAPAAQTRAAAPVARDDVTEPAEAQPKKRTAPRKKKIAKARPAPEVATIPAARSPEPPAASPATTAARTPASSPSLSVAPTYVPPPGTAGATPTFAATSAADPVVVAPAPAPAPSSAAKAQPSAILDPFGQTPVNTPFHSLY